MTSEPFETAAPAAPTANAPFLAPRIPSECPVCGAYSLAPEADMSVLLAVCDVLVIKALEKMGNFLRREKHTSRSERRDQILRARGIPTHQAHMLWTPVEETVTKALRGAWDVVPAILENHGGCCNYDSAQVVEALDQYVHDLAITATEHDIDELAYRLRSGLGLPVYRVPVEQPSAV